ATLLVAIPVTTQPKNGDNGPLFPQSESVTTFNLGLIHIRYPVGADYFDNLTLKKQQQVEFVIDGSVFPNLVSFSDNGSLASQVDYANTKFLVRHYQDYF